MQFQIDPDSLTLDELDDLTEAAPNALDVLQGKSSMSFKVVKALVWIMRRREDPSVTIEDVGQMKLTDIDFQGPDPKDSNAPVS